jgi:hypothetical protein
MVLSLGMLEWIKFFGKEYILRGGFGRVVPHERSDTKELDTAA